VGGGAGQTHDTIVLSGQSRFYGALNRCAGAAERFMLTGFSESSALRKEALKGPGVGGVSVRSMKKRHGLLLSIAYPKI